MADEAAVRELIGRLRDPWKPVRNQAAQQLVDLGEPVIPLVRELLDGHDDDLAQYAVWVLESLDTPETAEILDAYWARGG